MNKIIKIKNINKFSDTNLDINFSKYEVLNLLEDASIKKILILKWGGMGDLIIASAVIDDILNNFKNHIVHFNTLPQWQSLFDNDKRINKIWGFNFNSWLKKIFAIYKWLKIVHKEKYDLIIDLQTNDRSRIILSFLKLFSSRSKYIIGNHPVYPYDLKTELKFSSNQPLIILQKTIATIGIKPIQNNPRILLKNKMPDDLKVLFIKNKLKNKEFIIFIPGSSKKNTLKRWGVQNFFKLSKLLKNSRYKIVLIGGADDISENRKIAKLNQNILNFSNKVSLINLIYLFRQARLIVANDTGPTHLASCTDTPIIQITGPTDPHKVKPYGKNIISLQSDISCKNCYKKICGHHSCMIGLRPELVYSYVKNYL
jgi:heptosyltransferase-2